MISAGHHSTHGPGGFHAFQFGHPRESIVRDLEARTSGARPAASIYTMRGVEDKLPDRITGKAVFCTCWDGAVVVTMNADGTSPPIATSGW